jgi:hypothetical protein
MRILMKSRALQVLLFLIILSAGLCIFLRFEGFAAETDRAGVLCQIGYWCPASSDSDKSLPCPGGTYGSTKGQESPKCDGLCEAGCMCPEASTDPCPEPCPAGFFCGEGTGGSAVPPVICPQGFYCPISSTEPTPCPAGTACPEGTSSLP